MFRKQLQVIYAEVNLSTEYPLYFQRHAHQRFRSSSLSGEERVSAVSPTTEQNLPGMKYCSLAKSKKRKKIEDAPECQQAEI